MQPGAWLVIAAALLPLLGLAALLRLVERHQREPYQVLLRLFLYGVAVAAVWAAALAGASRLDAVWDTLGPAGSGGLLLYAILWAPLWEELLKGFGLRLGRRHLDEEEDGLVHGAAIGLGFAATENALYGLLRLQSDGLGAALAILAVRLASSTVLHVAASAILGWAYVRVFAWGAASWTIVPAYLCAAAVHAAYNGLLEVGTAWSATGAVLLACGLVVALRVQVHRMDRAAATR